MTKANETLFNRFNELAFYMKNAAGLVQNDMKYHKKM